MFAHPMSVFGFLVSGAGWLFMTTGVEAGGSTIINLHAVSIAENVILLGYLTR